MGRGVDVAVLRFGRAAERFDVAQIANDRMRAARGDALGFFRIAHKRGHRVSAANQRVKHCGTDIAGCTSQENAHGTA